MWNEKKAEKEKRDGEKRRVNRMQDRDGVVDKREIKKNKKNLHFLSPFK